MESSMKSLHVISVVNFVVYHLSLACSFFGDFVLVQLSHQLCPGGRSVGVWLREFSAPDLVKTQHDAAR